MTFGSKESSFLGSLFVEVPYLNTCSPSQFPTSHYTPLPPPNQQVKNDFSSKWSFINIFPISFFQGHKIPFEGIIGLEFQLLSQGETQIGISQFVLWLALYSLDLNRGHYSLLSSR
jgi:hypothetical protein